MRNSELLSTVEAAQYIGLAAPTLNKGRCTGNRNLPGFIKVGRAVYYRRVDLDAWLRSRPTFQSTAEVKHAAGGA